MIGFDEYLVRNRAIVAKWPSSLRTWEPAPRCGRCSSVHLERVRNGDQLMLQCAMCGYVGAQVEDAKL